LDANRADWI